MEKSLKGSRPAVYGEGKGLPLNMLVEVTNACNHACIFCAHAKMRRKAGLMDADLFKDIARQAYAGGTREIGFYMTGEPLVHPRLVDFVACAKELGFTYIYMTTNGSLAAPERLKPLIQAGMNSIKFSINAGTAETYRRIHGRDDFAKVIANLRAVSEYVRSEKLDVGIFATCIVCRQNVDEVETLRTLVKDLVDEFRPVNAYNQGGNMHEITQGVMLDPDYRPMKAPCGMLFSRLHVTCEGFLNACCVDFDNNLVVADLRKTSLLEAWNGERMRFLREAHLNDRIPRSVMCYNCINNANEKTLPLVDCRGTDEERAKRK